MMKKNAIALALAGLSVAPLTAAAAGHWEVITPSSVNESAPQLLGGSHLPPAPVSATTVATATDVDTSPASARAITPVSLQDTGYTPRTESRRNPGRLHTQANDAAARKQMVRAGGGLPNPQTPWSPNESGEQHYAQDMQAYRQQVASVEQARIATAESYAPQPAVAQLESTPVDKEAAADVDRLLANPSNAPADREPATVARVTPALVDSRLPGTSDLRVDTTTPDQPASATPEQPAPDAASTSTAAAPDLTVQPAVPPTETGASTVAAASSAVAGGSAPVEAAVPVPEGAPAPAAPAPVGAIAAPEITPETQASTPIR